MESTRIGFNFRTVNIVSLPITAKQITSSLSLYVLQPRQMRSHCHLLQPSCKKGLGSSVYHKFVSPIIQFPAARPREAPRDVHINVLVSRMKKKIVEKSITVGTSE